jgi:Protein of unknown function (DUF732)
MSQCAGGRVCRGRRLRVASAVAAVALVLAACGRAGVSATQLDAQFVDSVHADGHDVPRGSDGEAALVAAARKICERRDHLAMRRRDSALTPRELDVVEQTFAGDPRRFATLALETYCP